MNCFQATASKSSAGALPGGTFSFVKPSKAVAWGNRLPIPFLTFGSAEKFFNPAGGKFLVLPVKSL
jgi:hypothetical protein